MLQFSLENLSKGAGVPFAHRSASAFRKKKVVRFWSSLSRKPGRLSAGWDEDLLSLVSIPKSFRSKKHSLL